MTLRAAGLSHGLILGLPGLSAGDRRSRVVDRGAAYYERKRANRDLTYLKRKAAELSLRLVPAA